MDVETFFEFFKTNPRELESYKPDINRNAVELINFLSEPNRAANNLQDQERNNASLKLINHFITITHRDITLESLVRLVNLYSTPENCNKYYSMTSISRNLFELLIRANMFTTGLELFSRIASYFPSNEFNNSKAYSIYCAYQMKSYSHVQNILDTNYFEVKSDYKDYKDFHMMNFYKGLIFLSKMELLKSAVCFQTNFTTSILGGSYTHFQVDSLQRLMLLYFLVDGSFVNTISQTLQTHKKLISTKSFDLYVELQKMFSSRQFSFTSASQFIEDNSKKLKNDRTNSLAKLCLKQVTLNKVLEVFKSYKRIRLNKLSLILEMESSVILNYVKQFSVENKLSIKFDDVEEILENTTEKNSENPESIEKLKFYYSQAENNLQYKSLTLDDSSSQMRTLLLESQGGFARSNSKKGMRGINPDQY